MERTQIDIEIDAIADKVKSDGGCLLWIHFDNEDVNIRRAGDHSMLVSVLVQSMKHDKNLTPILMRAIALRLQEE